MGETMYELSVSRKEVGRTGDRLVNSYNQKTTYLDDDVNILHEWRMCHVYPLEQMVKYLDRESKLVCTNALVSSRIKRLPSIVSKLARFSNMNLSKMQDLGGCRAIVDDIDQVYTIRDNILNLKFHHEFKKEDDYILNTKESGYKSLHLVYGFKNTKYPLLNGLKIEMQLRTAIQHSWATAVEMVGIFRRESLKSNMGDPRWLRFFILVSELFYQIESKDNTLRKSHNMTSEELKLLSRDLNVSQVLNAFSQIAEHINQSDKYTNGYCVIIVDTDKRKIDVKSFAPLFFKKASQFYLEQERFCANNSHKVVAMVSVNSLHELKTAYPAFFLDTKTFINNLNKFIY